MHVIYLCRDHFQACQDFRRQLIESKKGGQNIRAELSLSSGCGWIQREVNSLAEDLQGFFWTFSGLFIANRYFTSRQIGAKSICTDKTELPLLFQNALIIVHTGIICSIVSV